MSGGAEFLLWLLLFALIIGLAVIVEIVENQKRKRSPWLRSFDGRRSR